nr:GNAT family N-acetyltransferase [Bacilli bacterium]
MELILVDKNNYKKAIEIQRMIFPKEDGALNILASLDRDLFIEKTGLDYVDDHVKYYLAKVDDNYIGITGIYYYDSDNAWLAWFGILKEFRNNGLGRQLLRNTVSKVKTMNFKTMRLYTDFIDNKDAIKLYEEEGFVGEKYTLEELSYDCRIYSKSLINDDVDL